MNKQKEGERDFRGYRGSDRGRSASETGGMDFLTLLALALAASVVEDNLKSSPADSGADHLSS